MYITVFEKENNELRFISWSSQYFSTSVFLRQVIHSRPQDLIPKPIEDNDPSLRRPDEEAVEENTEKTRLALEKLVSGKISAAMPVRHAEKQAPAQYIRLDVVVDPIIRLNGILIDLC